MGKSVTPKYVVEMEGAWGKMCWKGPATKNKLGEYVAAFIKSCKPGGPNAHLEKYPPPTWARIVENCCGGGVVAKWEANEGKVGAA